MKVFLDNEKEILADLERQYTQALADVKRKIAELKGREVTDSITYQLGYQYQLEEQLSAVLGELQNGTIGSITDYLNRNYTDGVITANYELMKQGIPLVLPIDHDAVLFSVSKRIEGMDFADRIGTNMDAFKQKMKDEIARGMAGGLSYAEIARNISSVTTESLNSAYRIARTEGGRVQSESRYAAARYAQEKGADIVNQWSAALDSRTRETHQHLDGEIREIDEPFESSGHKALYPRGFGAPAEDINCRCVLLTRARWALDEETRTRMAEVDGVKQLIEAKNYKEYKEKYLDVTKQ
ncbi:phage head morphogenesis protein [Eubacteriales bacterium OttesenSCG-928-M02]|nr:phage head morphogenesis protein [Eubacteriales bacterium OttesenSCG-928-M02]